ncbi:hypothetical protein MKX01_031920 [Papaver californicum]|nr:hypothetical protein MKX01_031920 [Papaver californicum]
MAGVSRKISAAPARSHTRKSKQNSFEASPGMFRTISLVLLMGFMAWAYQTVQAPPPKIWGSPDGPSVTASRVKLSDGRYLAYKEHGVSKDQAKYKIIYIHGFDSCRLDSMPLSQELAKELGIYMVSFDRAGYGESVPNPKRTEKSTALDIEQLADQLGLGSKFYVVGFSMGGQATWGCLKYIPHRLSGAALLAPVVNYWWAGFPANVSKEAYNEQLVQDQWALRVAHYAPLLTYWWNTQKWFPPSSAVVHNPAIFSRQDKELMPKLAEWVKHAAQIRQQGDFESLHRDLMVGFGSWEFDPMSDIENPFQNNEGSVHVWQGDEDLLVPASLQRYVAGKLPWVHYHELTGAGHMFPFGDGISDIILKALLLGEK